MKISGGSVWIGQESVYKKTPSCRFAGGGLCEGAGNNPPTVIAKSKGYDNEKDANDA